MATEAGRHAARGRPLERLRRAPLFLLLVVLPSLVAIFYYTLLAAPMYVSEARFIVRSPSNSTPMALDSVLLGAGLGGAGGETTNAYVVHEYITSRQAAHDLELHQDLRAVLNRSGADFIARFPRPFEKSNFERLYKAYLRFVTVGYNAQTGISTLRVQAFSPEDAQNIANALLNGGEGVINQLNDRAAEDAVNDAHRRITEAEAGMIQAESALTDFRNRQQLIDPTRASLAGLDLQGKIEAQLASLRASRAALAASAPQSPQLPEIDRQITALQAQADTERSKMAGQDTSLAPMIGEYERLTIERDFAAKEMEAASASAEAATLEMRRKRLYLERVVPPNLPDAPTMPQRLHDMLMVMFTCLLIYGVVILVRAGLKEHGQS